MSNIILRLPEVLKRRARSRSSHYLDVQHGLCTKPVSIGYRAVGWPENEIDILNSARIAGFSDDEIRLLVKELEVSRKSFKHEGYVQGLVKPLELDRKKT